METKVTLAQGSMLFRGTVAGDGSVTYQIINNLTNFSGPNFSRAEIDTTHLHSTSRSYVLGLKDAGDFTASMNLDLSDPVHKALITDLNATESTPFKLLLSSGDYVHFQGQVKGLPLSGAVDALVTGSLTIRITGETEWHFKAAKANILWDSKLAAVEATGAVTGDFIGSLSATSVGTDAGLVPKFSSGPFVHGVHYRVEGVPAGLTVAMARTSETKATLTFSGTATDTSDTTGILLEMTDAAFAGNLLAADVAGAAKVRIALTFI